MPENKNVIYIICLLLVITIGYLLTSGPLSSKTPDGRIPADEFRKNTLSLVPTKHCGKFFCNTLKTVFLLLL